MNRKELVCHLAGAMINDGETSSSPNLEATIDAYISRLDSSGKPKDPLPDHLRR